ncbi:predicted GTPase, G3E family [Sanguibacter keddieii DSM 10542]|uniref:Predicted GTPase, G3E family n=1 Tax=Sanguibacter keddieii (strain ATCC 51767 / DSM 10542 / NCFB 3025 / ST-74) TaxID=446469 RepID=D1BB60_SANKS|nr:GTP-binding protein [Sanguibacter keddieii]ACZ20626.1 predicted GTPase, G3E family [Sanguibacter keddieii DSM 10542]
MAADTPARGPLPVTVIAGYLGAGKTSLLNHLLAHPRGSRIAVVVNDFGDVGIDPMLVSTSATAVYATSGGCFCCVLDDEDDLHPLLTRLARRGAGVDAVLLEASGLADPQALARRVAEHPATVLAGVLQVVDAVETAQTLTTHPSLAHHLATADLVVVNKADLVDDPAEVVALCRDLNPHAPVVTTVEGRIDPALVLDAPSRPDRGDQQLLAHAALDEHASHASHASDGSHEHPHLHHEAQSLSIAHDGPLAPGPLMDLLEDRPPGLFRVKGVVHLALAPGGSVPVVVHAAGRQVRVDVLRSAPDATSRLVAIGSGLDLEVLQERLDACRAAADTAPSREDLARVRRRTVRPGRRLDPPSRPSA